MADLTDIQAVDAVKIVGSDSLGIEQTPVQSTNQGGLHSNLRDSNGNEQGILANPLFVHPVGYKTYSAASTPFTAPSSPTDVFTITGSGTKTIHIKKIAIHAQATNTKVKSFLIIKRSTANSGGTSSTLTAVPHDSDDDAATAVVRSYTANPTLGTTVGIIRSFNIVVPQNSPLGGAANGPITELSFGDVGASAVTLRGTNEVLSINLNGTTMSGNSLTCYVEWVEV